MCPLLLRSKSDGGPQADDGGLVLLQAGFSDGVGDRSKIPALLIRIGTCIAVPPIRTSHRC